MNIKCIINSFTYTSDYERITDCLSSGNKFIGSHERYLKARCISKFSPDDNFNLEFGEALAKQRALQKMHRKMEKELLKYSYKRSRKKYLFDYSDLDPLDKLILGEIYNNHKPYFKYMVHGGK